ncbi:hypothetical protein GCM10027051_19630 [Niabella terrae]
MFAVAACSTLTAGAQKAADAADFAKVIQPSWIQQHLSVIASAEMGGRDTPSPGLEKAAEYIESQFKSFGVKPANKGSYRQYFELESSSASQMELTLGGTRYTAFTDYAPWISMPEQAELQFSDYVYVGYGLVDEGIDDYKSVDVTGKLVVLLAGQPQGFTTKKSRRQSPAFTGNKIENARKKGAAAVLIISEVLPDAASVSDRYRPVPDEAEAEATKAIPAFYISDKIVQETGNHSISDLKKMTGTQITEPAVMPGTAAIKYQSGRKTARVSNVLGMIEGTDKKDEYLFVTAHYDHVGTDAKGNIYYGADDDGSGTVAVMNMAAAFAQAKKAGKGPRRTIVFMLVCGEEKGLWGSEYYSEHPVFPLDKTTADLNIDMIGRIDTERMLADTLNYVYVIGHNKLSSDLQPINEGANNKYTRLTLDYKFDDPNDPNRIYYRSDHYNFARKGVPILFFYDGMLQADYHKPTDTVDKINFPLLTKRAQMIFYTAWDIANRDALLKRDIPLTQ